MKNRVHPTLRIAAAPLILLGLALPAVSNCNGIEIPSSTCTELESGDVHELKLDGQKKSFLNAAVNLDKFVYQQEEDLIETCQMMGRTLEIDETELDVAPARGEGAKQVCDLVIDKLDSLYADIGEVTIEIKYDPPRCEQDVGVTKACFARCDASFDAQKSELPCKDGEISGVCEDVCLGSCILKPGSSCKGTCEGVCRGKCDGKAAKDGKPSRCAGTCEGSCTGPCTVESKAPAGQNKPPPPPSSSSDDEDEKPKKNPNCKGLCQGTCADGLRNATCSGEPKAKVASACVTTCAVAVAPSTTCRPPTLVIAVEGDDKKPPPPGQPPAEPTAEEKTREENRSKLLKALRQGLPRIIALQQGLDKRLSDKIDALMKLGGSMAVNGADPNDKAALCLNGANDILGGAALAFGVNVQVGASVSAAARLDSTKSKEGSSGKRADK
jgi:hypothetical protein